MIAGVAAFMAYTFIQGERSRLVKEYGQKSSVVVAKVDIGELDILDESKVTTVSIPKKFLNPGYLRDPKEVINTIATVPIIKGEQIY